MPANIRRSMELWVGCIAGALRDTEYAAKLAAAGFTEVAVEPWEASRIEDALRVWAEGRGEKPRQAFAPIRLAVTGTDVSPGLFESLELLGKDESLARLSAAAGTA